MSSLRAIFLIFSISFFPRGELKVYTVCELTEELYNEHTIPREEIYRHLCIISDMLVTNHSTINGFHGIYRIGERWWCGNYEPGGNCNITCDSLKDDDLRDDVACAEKILESHGTLGWMKSEKFCLDKFAPKVDGCLETVEQFEKNTQASEPEFQNTTAALKSDVLNEICQRHDNKETSDFSLYLNFALGFLLIASMCVTFVIFLKYKHIRDYMRTAIINSVHMSVDRDRAA